MVSKLYISRNYMLDKMGRFSTKIMKQIQWLEGNSELKDTNNGQSSETHSTRWPRTAATTSRSDELIPDSRIIEREGEREGGREGRKRTLSPAVFIPHASRLQIREDARLSQGPSPWGHWSETPSA